MKCYYVSAQCSIDVDQLQQYFHECITVASKICRMGHPLAIALKNRRKSHLFNHIQAYTSVRILQQILSILKVKVLALKH